VNKLVSRTDTLRHVRFAGRPTAAAARHVKRANLPLPPALPAASASERPGAFISWVFERAGLAVESYRGEPLRRRLSACLRALHAHTEAQARRILEERPALLPAAVSALLIGTTEFFRDAPVYETLRTEALPKLPRRSRPLRVWSAACSSGAELYSLAILLAEAGLLEGSFLWAATAATMPLKRLRRLYTIPTTWGRSPRRSAANTSRRPAAHGGRWSRCAGAPTGKSRTWAGASSKAHGT